MTTPTHDADLILIGGGIMSATLGAMLSLSDRPRRIILVERGPSPAEESSGPWNNAGTGHSGYCELNYMPDPTDAGKASLVASQFAATRRWWDRLAEDGLINPDDFLHAVPHMDVVFGQSDVEYLKKRSRTLMTEPGFADLQFSDDPTQIAKWAPLVVRGRPDGPIAATRHSGGTDVDFGSLTRALIRIITDRGGKVLLNHEVRDLKRIEAGWQVTGRQTNGNGFSLSAGFVFVGAGGYALRLLQKARLPEVSGYAVLPVGAAFLRTSAPAVVAQHRAKVYGQAAVGAPPMSVPHLDARTVDDENYVMFGPYATFSTKLLKHGRLTDAFTILRWRNLPVIAAALCQNVGLIRYLITELLSSRRRKFDQLRQFVPTARPEEWELIAAGQRAQLVKPDRRRIGRLEQGTEMVVSADRTIAGLLGASPGASTAVPIMSDLIEQCFSDE